MKFVSIDIWFSTLNFCQNFVCVKPQRTIIANSIHLVPLYLMINHHLYHFFTIFNDLSQGHINMDATQHFWFKVNLLNILQISHYAFVVYRKRNIFDIDQNLIYWSVGVAAHFYLLHDGVDKHLVKMFRIYVEFIFLVVQLTQNAFQVRNCWLLWWKIVKHSLIEYLFSSIQQLFIKWLNLL